jgi:hypothetical protein
MASASLSLAEPPLAAAPAAFAGTDDEEEEAEEDAGTDEEATEATSAPPFAAAVAMDVWAVRPFVYFWLWSTLAGAWLAACLPTILPSLAVRRQLRALYR